jgi:hypothetical protein
MNSRITRRDFVCNTALAATGAALTGLSHRAAAMPLYPPSDIRFGYAAITCFTLPDGRAPANTPAVSRACVS